MTMSFLILFQRSWFGNSDQCQWLIPIGSSRWWPRILDLYQSSKARNSLLASKKLPWIYWKTGCPSLGSIGAEALPVHLNFINKYLKR